MARAAPTLPSTKRASACGAMHMGEAGIVTVPGRYRSRSAPYRGLHRNRLALLSFPWVMVGLGEREGGR